MRVKAWFERYRPLIRGKERAVVTMLLVAVVGTAALVSSFAATPPAVPEPKLPLNKQPDFIPVSGRTIDASTHEYDNSQSFPFSFRYPSNWSIIKLTTNTATTENALSLRLTAPNTEFSNPGHTTETVINKGALVEVTAANNTQFRNAAEYLKPLKDYIAYSTSVNVAGHAAVEYRLSEKFEHENRAKIITTFFANSIQYSISFSADAEELTSPYLSAYKQVIATFKLSP